MVLAVTYFENRTGDSGLDDLGRGLADMLITDLTGVSGLQVVERSRLNALIEEMSLVKQGIVRPETAASIGRGLGARYVLIGSFSAVEDTLRVDARIVRVETNEVVAARSVSGKKNAFFRLEKELAKAILAALSIHVSARDSIKIERVSTQSFEAIQAWSRGLASLDRGAMQAAKRELSAALEYDDAFAEARLTLESIEKRLDSIASARSATTSAHGATALAAVRRYRESRTPVSYQAFLAAINPWTRLDQERLCGHANDIRAIAQAILDLGLKESRLIRASGGEMPLNEWAMEQGFFAAWCLWDTVAILADGELFLERYPLSPKVQMIEENMREVIDVRKREEQGERATKGIRHEWRTSILCLLCVEPSKVATNLLRGVHHDDRRARGRVPGWSRSEKHLPALTEDLHLRVCREASSRLVALRLSPSEEKTDASRLDPGSNRGSRRPGLDQDVQAAYLRLAIKRKSKEDLDRLLSADMENRFLYPKPADPTEACSHVKPGTDQFAVCRKEAVRRVAHYRAALAGHEEWQAMKDSRLREKIQEARRPFRRKRVIRNGLRKATSGAVAERLLLELWRSDGLDTARGALEEKLKKWPTVNGLHRVAVRLAFEGQDFAEARRVLEDWKASYKVTPPRSSPLAPHRGLPRMTVFKNAKMRTPGKTYFRKIKLAWDNSVYDMFGDREDEDIGFRWSFWLWGPGKTARSSGFVIPTIAANGPATLWIDGKKIVSVEADPKDPSLEHSRNECPSETAEGARVELSAGKRREIRVEFRHKKRKRPDDPCESFSPLLSLQWHPWIDPKQEAKRKAEAQSKGRSYYTQRPRRLYPNTYSTEFERYSRRAQGRYAWDVPYLEQWTPHLERRLPGIVELEVVGSLLEIEAFSAAATILMGLVDDYPNDLEHLGSPDDVGLGDPRSRARRRKLGEPKEERAALFLINIGHFAEKALRQPLAKKAYRRLLKYYGETSYASAARAALAGLPP